ncbi:tetratricopeptide repeat protein [Okeania sp.]|uniref:tetratricopeptide repeat protein n=1 Tax=Okeania sp. TaxID=3100323 RepID=UPI002B4AD149|nr:tetratricopeptide repeat protein [Okeania sp.]MEB3341293.1 tetratricopeptide repeat protein [Okeania sp.]
MQINEESQKTNAEEYLQAANQLKQEGKLDRAINVYCLAGDAFIQANQISYAISAYKRVLVINPNYARIYMKVAYSYYLKKQVNLAIKNYIAALHLDPGLVPALNQLANIYRSNKRVKQGVFKFQRLVEQQPNNGAFQAILGTFMKEVGNDKEAILAYQQAISNQPNLPVYNSLTSILKQSNQMNEATVAYQKLVETQPKNGLAYVELAECFNQQGNIKSAVNICQQFIDSNFFDNNKQKINVELSNLNQLEKLIITIATTKIENLLFINIMRFVLSLKENKAFSWDLRLFIAEEIVQDDGILFDKKFCLLAVLSCFNSVLENAFKCWLQDFSKHSSIDQNIVVFAALNPSNFLSVRRLEFKNILSPKIRQFLVENINNDITKKLTYIFNNDLNTESYKILNSQNSEFNNFLFVFSFLDFYKTSSHLKTVIDYAYFLTKEMPFSKVNILVTDEFSFSNCMIDSPKRILKDKDRTQFYEILHSFYQDASKDRIKFIIPEVALSPSSLGSDYTLHILRKLISCMPDIVIFFGGVFGSLILPEVVYKYYPTIYAQFNTGNNTKHSFDIYISCNPREVSNQFANRINSDRWRFHEYIYAPFPSEDKHSMEMVKSSPESITVVTVGFNLNGRISDPEYLDCLVNLLELYPQLEWYLIGVNNEEEFLSRNVKLPSLYTLGRLKLVKFEEDLLSFYRFCDIYTYPAHSGGGRGTFLAATQGLPILCFKNNDAEGFLPTECIFNNNDDYFSFLEKLISNPSLRISLGKKNQERVSENRTQKSLKEFLGFCQEARLNFMKRIG